MFDGPQYPLEAKSPGVMNRGFCFVRMTKSEWRKAASVEQILLPLRIRPPHQPHDVTAGVQIERPRLAREPHVGLVRQHVPLAAIAIVAAGHEVLPRGRPTARAWHHVIERKLTRSQD